MIIIWNLFFILLIPDLVITSKLNLPRVLLPLFKSVSTNFTLKVTDNGCYKWTLSRLDVIQLIPLNINKRLDCSSEVILSTITKELVKNTVIVLVEEVITKEVLRCDVIVDVISSLQISTKTRQLLVEESPEIFEVRAYDDQGNEFSTLEGIEFLWSINSGNRNSVFSKVLRLLNFKDSSYEIPSSVYNLDVQGLRGHLVLIEGIKTGTANVSVELLNPEYKYVSPTVVQLDVIANLIIEPSDTYMLQGDVIYYKLLQVKNGRFVEIPLPSTQYSLNIENESIVQQYRPWVFEALSIGQTKLFLSDVYSKMSNFDDATYLPSVTLTVVAPTFMHLLLLPYKSWITTVYNPAAITAELYDSDNHKIYLGPHAIVTISVDQKFSVTDKTLNGSYVEGYAIETGIVHIEAEFKSVRSNNNVLIPFNTVNTQADILVYDRLVIRPNEIFIPFDSHMSSKLNYPLNVTGGDGSYQWISSNVHIAVVTQAGVIKPREVGQTDITVHMQKNSAIYASAKIVVETPNNLKIVYNTIESEVGYPVYLGIGLYFKNYAENSGKDVLFNDCSGLPYRIESAELNIYYNTTRTNFTLSNACTFIGIISKDVGSTLVTLSYLTNNGILLKDTAVISFYKPMQIITPLNKKTVLSVGSQRYIVFSGGPTSGAHKISKEYDDSVLSVEELHEVDETERIYRVTCQTIGESTVSLKIFNQAFKDDVTYLNKVYNVDVKCAVPESLRLSYKIDDMSNCPSVFQTMNVVLNNKSVLLMITIFDNEGNVFDNATSLTFKWILSNEELGVIRFPGIIKLQEEDRGNYKLPLYHFQVIKPAMRAGDVDVTVKILNYRKSWLKKLSINWDDKNFKIANLEETISLKLIDSVRITPEYLCVYDYPKNIAKFYLHHGSGFFKISITSDNAAQINYSETTRTVDIIPLLPGSFKVIVKDECFDSEAITADIVILTISNMEIDIIDKVEKGKTIKAFVKLYDSAGNIASKENIFNLKVEIDSNILSVNCSDSMEKKNDDRIICLITGLEAGFVNLVFIADTIRSILHSKPIRMQIYPPLQLTPKDITLVPGVVFQLLAKGGPQQDCFIEYSTENNVVVIDNSGTLIADELGECLIIGKAVGIGADGEKIVYSLDTVRVNVVYLEGIRIKTPLLKIKSGTKMPIWVEGIPEHLNPMILSSVSPPLSFKWSISSPNLVHIASIFEETGIQVPDTDKVSMRLHSLKSGRVSISVQVSAPEKVTSSEHKGIFTDIINIEIFDELYVINAVQNSLLLAPNMQHQLETNKDKVAQISYKLLNSASSRSSLLEIDEKGLITTFNIYDSSVIQIHSIEENDWSQMIKVVVEVSPVKYLMLNIKPDFQMTSESFVYGLPKGMKLRFYVSYHDSKGSVFANTNYDLKYQFNEHDKIRVSQFENEKSVTVDLFDVESTVMKIFTSDLSLLPDYVKISTAPYISPDKINLTVGDVVCFSTPDIKTKHSCFWNSSDENSLSINKNTGFAIVKSKQNNILVTFQCSSYLQLIATVDIYSLKTIDVVPNKIKNLSNNGKRNIIPLILINELEEASFSSKTSLWQSKHSCINENDKFYFPYGCEIKFSNEITTIDINSVLKVYEHFDIKYGHTCVIESENTNLQLSNQFETDIILKISWGRYLSTSVVIPFKPAISVFNSKLTITNQETSDILIIHGLKSVLNDVQIIPSHSKYIGYKKDYSDQKNTLKYSVYLKTANLKEYQIIKDFCLFVISEVTQQNISVPLMVNIDAESYVAPLQISEQITQYLNPGQLKLLISAIITALLIYFGGLALYRKYIDKKDDSIFLDMSHNRSHSSPYNHRSPTFNEIQMIYGQSPERSLRSRKHM